MAPHFPRSDNRGIRNRSGYNRRPSPNPNPNLQNRNPRQTRVPSQKSNLHRRPHCKRALNRRIPLPK